MYLSRTAEQILAEKLIIRKKRVVAHFNPEKKNLNWSLKKLSGVENYDEETSLRTNTVKFELHCVDQIDEFFSLSFLFEQAVGESFRKKALGSLPAVITKICCQIARNT